MLTEKYPTRLSRHHHLTIGLFVLFWICFLTVIVLIELFELPELLENALIALMFSAAITAVILQFSQCCPNCKANLGLQVRLGIPERCHKCGVQLRKREC